MPLSTENITPFATYYMVGMRGDVWWLHCIDIDCCPPRSGQVGDRHAPKNMPVRNEYLRDVLNSLGNAAATKSP